MRLLRATIVPLSSLLLFATILGRNSADAFGPLLWRRRTMDRSLPSSAVNKAEVRPQWEREKDVQCGTSHYQPPMPSHNFSDNDSRRFNIINGHRVPNATDLPWMATLWGPFPYVDDFPACSGTIIGRRHVLVAGHCLWLFYLFHGHGNKNWPPMDTSVFTVHVGVTDYSDRTATKVVSRRIIPHPNVTMHLWPLPIESSDDLAIVELSEPLNFTQTVQPICLHAYNQNGPWNTTVATMAGFGLLDMFHSIKSTELHDGYERILDPKECANQSRQFSPDKNICGGDSPMSVCDGDSGGALLLKVDSLNWVQIGIVSMHLGREGCTPPDVYTSVGPYCSWIEQVTEGSVLCK